MISRLVLGLLWLFHWLPLPVQAAAGRGLGALLWRLGRSRRRIALRNLELCLPELPAEERKALDDAYFCEIAHHSARPQIRCALHKLRRTLAVRNSMTAPLEVNTLVALP